MSDIAPPTPPPDPPTPPAQPPAAAPAPPAEPPLDDLISRLATFDPAAIDRRLDELAGQVANSQPVTAIREALAPLFDDLGKGIRELTGLLKGGGSVSPPAAPAAAPDPTPAPAPAAPPAAPGPAPHSVSDTLFGVPRV